MILKFKGSGVRRKYKRKKRPQKVRFRRRYATSIFQKSITRVWTGVKVLVFAGVVASVSIFGWKFWNESPLLRVENVEFSGALPVGLKKKIGIKSGDHLLLLNISEMEKAGLSQFPELEQLSVTRKLNRSVIIRGNFRTPLAIWGDPKNQRAIDKYGVIFRLPEQGENVAAFPIYKNFQKPPPLGRMGKALQNLKENRPDFYGVIKNIKTDRMGTEIITLTDGILIYWGEVVSDSIVEKSDKVLEILNRFEPVKSDAALRFLDDDRIVLDTKWKEIKPI